MRKVIITSIITFISLFKDHIKNHGTVIVPVLDEGCKILLMKYLAQFDSFFCNSFMWLFHMIIFQ